MFRENFVVIGQLWRTSMIVSPPAAEGVSMGFLTSSAPLPPPRGTFVSRLSRCGRGRSRAPTDFLQPRLHFSLDASDMRNVVNQNSQCWLGAGGEFWNSPPGTEAGGSSSRPETCPATGDHHEGRTGRRRHR